MAKENPAAENRQAETAGTQATRPFLTRKMLLIGIPIVLVEAVAVYFLTAMFVVPKISGAERTPDPAKVPVTVPEPHVFVVNDLIVNPAGTNGTRFLLTTIGFEVSSPEAKAELEKKELQVRDVLNSILTAKGLDSLVDVRNRESLRQEIFARVRPLLTTGKPEQVYFSKFIIQ